MRWALPQIAFQVGRVAVARAVAQRLAPADIGVFSGLLRARRGDQIVVPFPGVVHIIPVSHSVFDSSPVMKLAWAWPDACAAGRMRLMEHFRTTRLIARDWTDGDAQAAFDIYGRDEVMRWLGVQPRRAVPSLTHMRERLDLMIQRARDEPEYGLWAVSLRTGPAAGAVVGAVLLSRLPGDDGDVEIGWHLNPDYWGNGYATEAGRGVVGLAFGLQRAGPVAGRPPLDRVIALVDPGNVRSQAVCRRLGMTHLGRTDTYYGLSLELFELVRTDATQPPKRVGRGAK